MTTADLKKGIVLGADIEYLENFLGYCKSNRNISFKKKKIVAEVSDYMREIKIFDLSPRLREKFILMLEEELESMREEFEKLGNEVVR